MSTPDSEPDCLLCHDIHWVYPRKPDGTPDYSQVERCQCVKEQDEKDRQESLLKYCGLPEMTEHKTLDKFLTFGDKPLKEALADSLKVAAAAEDIIFLTLIGKSDTGKSHLAIGICREWLERKRAARYANVPRMLNELREGYKRDGEESFYYRLNFYCTVGLLALDDFGTEKISEWGAEQLQTIINSRYDDALHTVVTSNRQLNDLFNFGDYPRETWRDFANMRIESRLQREKWCKVVVLDTVSFMERS